MRVAIVQSRFNETVVKRLSEGAVEALVKHGVGPDAIDHYVVPGAFEIPAAALRLVEAGHHDAVVCLGAVIRGETPHFDYVAEAAARGIAEAAFNPYVAVTFGVLTTENEEQALERAGGKMGDKGAEAAVAALEMANLYRVMPPLPEGQE